VVLGTAGSMWDYLVESVDLGEREEALRLALQDATDRRSVDQALLDRAGPLLESATGMPVRLRVVPYGRDRAEQHEILRLLAEEVDPGDALTLDITHGFRHLPLLALMSLLHLETVKGINVEAVYYGFYDPETGDAPVYDLAGLLEIAAWVAALRAFDADGDYAVLGPLLRDAGVGAEACEALTQAAFLERTTRAGDARARLRRFREALAAEPPGGTAALFTPVLLSHTDWVEHQGLYERQRALALRYLESRDHLRAAIYAFEAFVTARVIENGGNPESYDARSKAKDRFEQGERRAAGFADYRTLRDLRNALTHGARPPRREISSALSSPERLHATLRELFDRLLPEPR